MLIGRMDCGVGVERSYGGIREIVGGEVGLLSDVFT